MYTICKNCGCAETLESLRSRGKISCCPERQVVPIKDYVDEMHRAYLFQTHVTQWAMRCFGKISDKEERQDRFLEEVFELLQASGYDKKRISSLADYVYSRDVGKSELELGGVMTTLAVLSSNLNLNMLECGQKELARIEEKIDAIKEKQKSKPVGSALPIRTDVLGWLFVIDEGIEFSKNHPIESGEFPEATDIVEATAENILSAWLQERASTNHILELAMQHMSETPEETLIQRLMSDMSDRDLHE